VGGEAGGNQYRFAFQKGANEQGIVAVAGNQRSERHDNGCLKRTRLWFFRLQE